MKAYDYYLFDADGTLFDTVDIICDCFQHVSMKYRGKRLERDKIVKGIGLPLKDQILHHMNGELDYHEIVEEYKSYQLEIIRDRISLFPGVKETLQALQKKSKKMAIVTSRKHYSLDIFLEVTGTARYFTATVTPEDVENPKPHKEPTLKAMSLIGADRESTIFIGDAIYDIRSGTDAGVDTAFVNWSHVKAEDLSVKPTYTIDKIEDLLI